MHRHAHLALGLVAALASIVGILVVAPGQVAASVPGAGTVTPLCTNFGCGGKLPENEGCDDDLYVQTVTTHNGYGGYGEVQARYSPLCHAVWGRYDPQGSQPSCWDARLQIQVATRNASGDFVVKNSQTRNGDKCSWYWTKMLGADDRWVRVRNGYLNCGAGVCIPDWAGWSPWAKP